MTNQEIVNTSLGNGKKLTSNTTNSIQTVMKKVVSISLFIMGLLALNLNIMSAQNTTITVAKTVELSADQVWEQIRIMDNIDKLSSVVATVEWTGPKDVGGSRVCKSADGQGYFKENILDFSDAERTYTYAVVEGVPTKKMVNNFKVVDMGYQKSLILWTTNFEFMQNPNMTEEQFRGFLSSSIDEMIQNTIALATKS